MNILLIAANVLLLLTFFAHAFGGDRLYKKTEPQPGSDSVPVWVMGRGAFHLVSADILMALAGLTLVNFTHFFREPVLILRILSLYFFGHGLAFLLTLMISQKFPGKFVVLWQWMLMFTAAVLIWLGAAGISSN